MMRLLTQLLYGVAHSKEGSASAPDIWQGIDSALLFEIDRVSTGVLVLERDDVSPATKREVIDRIIRSMGQSVLKGQMGIGDYYPIEVATQTVLGRYYQRGVMDASVLCDSLRTSRNYPIERKSRNLAAALWEPKIQDAMQSVVDGYEENPQGPPVVVSVAWGGVEPALLLAGWLDAPIVYAKPDGKGRVASFSCQTIPFGGHIYIIEDRIRTGTSLKLVEEYVQQYLGPRAMQSVVVCASET